MLLRDNFFLKFSFNREYISRDVNYRYKIPAKKQ